MSDRHRGVPQIHIDSAESEMYPSNVEQVLRWGLLPEPRILEVENRRVAEHQKLETQEREPWTEPRMGSHQLCQPLAHWDLVTV